MTWEEAEVIYEQHGLTGCLISVRIAQRLNDLAAPLRGGSLVLTRLLDRLEQHNAAAARGEMVSDDPMIQDMIDELQSLQRAMRVALKS